MMNEGVNKMKTVILYESDFANNQIGMTWADLLDNLGIETHVLVGGRWIDKEIESVTLKVASVEAN